MPTSLVEETSDVPLQSDASNNTQENQSQYPADQEAQRFTSIMVQYLLENVVEFRELTELRKKVIGLPTETST
jgi:hypothetical protein